MARSSSHGNNNTLQEKGADRQQKRMTADAVQERRQQREQGALQGHGLDAGGQAAGAEDEKVQQQDQEHDDVGQFGHGIISAAE